jgi:hypothetical protein
MPTMPGMTVCPVRSMTRAPVGRLTRSPAPTAAIRPSRSTTVTPRCAGRPVPSMSVTFVNATTGSAIVTNSRTWRLNSGRAWPDAADAAASAAMIPAPGNTFIGCPLT